MPPPQRGLEVCMSAILRMSAIGKRVSCKRTFHRQCGLLAAIVMAGLSLMAQPARVLAHPLGNFTINRYSRLEVGRELRLLYVVDMAEIPAFQERSRIDADQDGAISAGEREQYLAREAAVLQSHLRLTIGGEAVPLQLQERSLEFPPGQAGLQTQRLTLRLVAALPQTAAPVDYADDNFADRLGWREVIVRAADGASLAASDAPAQDMSDELRRYPQDLLQNPASRHTAHFQFQPVASAPSADTGLSPQASRPILLNTVQSGDGFAALITIPDLGVGAILLALLAAFAWGGAHALTPGHGKTIVAAYLVGSRGTARHALFLGLSTTITHTAGVFALGLLTLFASRFILPEQLYPWLGVLSGLLVVTIGLSLFRGRLAAIVHPHEHQHDHVHPHTGTHHTHDLDGAHTHGHEHDHSHNHDHLPPGADGTAVTWRNLLALGISGGLLPCPSALVVMLSAIALERVGFGLLLIVAFSLGLAAVLTGIGLLFVHAGRLMNRIQVLGRVHVAARFIRYAPVLSAAFVSLAGLLITYEALAQTGVVRTLALVLPW